MARKFRALRQTVRLGRPAPKWDDRDAFSVEEAGEILGISRGSSYAAVNSGDLPVIRIGRRYIVPRAALERLLGAVG